MNWQQIEKWLDAEWHGWPRAVWVIIALAVGIAVNITFAKNTRDQLRSHRRT